MADTIGKATDSIQSSYQDKLAELSASEADAATFKSALSGEVPDLMAQLKETTDLTSQLHTASAMDYSFNNFIEQSFASVLNSLGMKR